MPLSMKTITNVQPADATFPVANELMCIQHQSADGLTAKAGGGQSGATLLSVVFNRFTTVGTAADSAILPPAVPGARITVVNAAAANSMNVFPATGEFINALAVNTAFAVAANKACDFICVVAGKWQALLSA